MTEPWQCPACMTWIRADVTEHRCNPGEGGVPAAVIQPAPMGGGSITTSIPEGWVITTNAPTTTTAFMQPATSGHLQSAA